MRTELFYVRNPHEKKVLMEHIDKLIGDCRNFTVLSIEDSPQVAVVELDDKHHA